MTRISPRSYKPIDRRRYVPRQRTPTDPLRFRRLLSRAHRAEGGGRDRLTHLAASIGRSHREREEVLGGLVLPTLIERSASGDPRSLWILLEALYPTRSC
jgi:hypothetical protein